jgi:hypothetical protein
MDTHTMCSIAKRLIPDYNIHERTGYPSSIAIPNQLVAKQIVEDIISRNLFTNFVNHLIELQETGRMGRKYQIPYLNSIIKGMYDLGFIYDSENSMFVENPRYRLTRNWSALRKGEEYTIAFLRIDIAGNSKLVRNHTQEMTQNAYNDLRTIVQKATHKRNGRLWSWEGDGGLAAFFFSNKHLLATLTAMDIVHSLFIYNRLENQLDDDLAVRIAVHSGLFEYTENNEDLFQSDTIKHIVELEEKYTQLNTISISPVVKVMLDEIVSRQFHPKTVQGERKYFSYELGWEPA